MVVCYLCKSSKEDDVQYGEMLQNENMSVHTFCLYLSSNLSQNGEDNEGFLGFLEADIKRESRRVSLLNCFYCHKAYANVGCCERKCRHSFHFICGVENAAENQFCGSFKSYCHQHVRKTNNSRPAENVVCLICYDNLQGVGQRFNRITMIAAPCCRNGWFHKLCLQRFAKTAGYFFKCPLCNDAQIFRQKLLVKGIFIPNQDAAWELEPNAFAELLERPNKCAAPECKYRTYASSSNPFIFCCTCGSTAMHRRCISNQHKSFQCADCTIAAEQDSGRGSLNTHANNYENDEDIDVCNVSDKEDLAIVEGLLQAIEPQSDGNDNKTQESCSSEDEEIKEIQSRRKRLLSSDSNSSEKRKENRPTSRRSSSSSTYDDEPNLSLTQRRNRKLKRCRVIRDSMSSEENLATLSTAGLRLNMEEDEVKIIHQLSPECRNSSSESKWESSIEESSNEETCSSLEDGNRDVEIISIDDESDDDESDEDEDEDLEPLKNNAQVQTKTGKYLTRTSSVSESSSSDESDDDPLENFTKMIEKQKNISCIAQRTRTKSVYVENLHQYKIENPSDSPVDNKKHSFQHEDRSKSIKFQESLDQEKYKTNLDISCIARRTRRKSMHCKSSETTTQAQSSKSLSHNQARNPARGRRKTVCSETAVEKSKQHRSQQDAEDIKLFSSEDSSQTTTTNQSDFYEMSQIFDKQYDTDDETGLQDNLQQAHVNVLDTSCVANRTRKRKFVRLENIMEEDESAPSSSCSSSTSYKTALTDFRSNYACRRRQRVLSTSSEDIENVYEGAFSTHRNKCSKKNYDIPFQKSKLHLRNSSSYYPSNRHHPHVNNRKRV